MKHEKPKPTKEVIESNQGLSSPSLEELQRSHHILEALIAVLPPHSKEELVDLLHTLAAGSGSPEEMNSVHQRALEIVSGVCKPNPPQELPSPEHGQETGERRQRDRRQR
jgi:hypothetical protein